MLPKLIKPLFPFPALIIESSERVLVVADLHIGWELSLKDHGIYLPSQIHKLQKKLVHIIQEVRPDRLIILGDVKQTITRISIEEWRMIPKFFETLQEYLKDIVVVLGNHDGNLEPLTPSTIKIIPPSGMTIGSSPQIGLIHGHAWPAPEVISSDILVMGHIHPVFWFKDRLGLWIVQQVWIKTKGIGENLARAYLKYLKVKNVRKPLDVFKQRVGTTIKDPEIIVVPAFNDLIGGVSINKLERRLLGPLLRSRGVEMKQAEIYLLDGTYLGILKNIPLYSTVLT